MSKDAQLNLLISPQELPVNDPDRSWDIISKTQSFLPIPTTTTNIANVKDADHTLSHSPTNAESSSYTRIACISDTHGTHREVVIPKCDVLIHGGDFTKYSEARIITDLANYFEEAVQRTKRAKKIIAIAGNHDLIFDEQRKDRLGAEGQRDAMHQFKKSPTCTYLENESFTHDTIAYYGSPWTPTFGGWAFNMDRHIIHTIWDDIPDDTDVLITHGPPLGRGDRIHNQSRVGCVNLLQQVQERIKPRLHVFGHIHENQGCSFDGKTLFVNASTCSLSYKPEQPCIVVDLPHDRSEPARLVIPHCALSGEEVLDWLNVHGYDQIRPNFKNMVPLLEGKDLVGENIDLEEIAKDMYRLRIPALANKRIKWRLFRKEFMMAMVHLRNDSY
jgi:Icc-related predicted phosphoesterase